MVQTPEMRIAPDPSLIAMHKHIYMPMLQTAETVAQRYGISRERQDEYALKSQQRTAAAQAAGRFNDEIVPVTTTRSPGRPWRQAKTTRQNAQAGTATPPVPRRFFL